MQRGTDVATVTFILGLCGAGKTWLADRVVAGARFDEGFTSNPTHHAALIEALPSGQDCVVVEIAYSIHSYCFCLEWA